MKDLYTYGRIRERIFNMNVAPESIFELGDGVDREVRLDAYVFVDSKETIVVS